MAPIRSGYIPFPEIKKRMMKAMEKVKQLPPEQQKVMMPKLMATKALMEKTKKHVQEAMAEGKMFGQPFFHVMFGNVHYCVFRLNRPPIMVASRPPFMDQTRHPEEAMPQKQYPSAKWLFQ